MTAPGTEGRGVLNEIGAAITNVAVPHHEPPAVVLCRRIVVVIVLVIGAALLGFSLSRTPGESSFDWLTFALAAKWTVGAFASGPLHLGSIYWRGGNQRPVITGTTIGLLLGGIFVLGGLVAARSALRFLIDTSVVKRLGHSEVGQVVEPLAAAGELARASICGLGVGYSPRPRNAEEWDVLVRTGLAMAAKSTVAAGSV